MKPESQPREWDTFTLEEKAHRVRKMDDKQCLFDIQVMRGKAKSWAPIYEMLTREEFDNTYSTQPGKYRVVKYPKGRADLKIQVGEWEIPLAVRCSVDTMKT